MLAAVLDRSLVQILPGVLAAAELGLLQEQEPVQLMGSPTRAVAVAVVGIIRLVQAMAGLELSLFVIPALNAVLAVQ